MAKHIGGNDIPQPTDGKTLTHIVRLEAGETAWMPGTTKHVYRGPCVLTYRIYPDGACECVKSDKPNDPAE